MKYLFLLFVLLTACEENPKTFTERFCDGCVRNCSRTSMKSCVEHAWGGLTCECNP